MEANSGVGAVGVGAVGEKEQQKEVDMMQDKLNDLKNLWASKYGKWLQIYTIK